MDKNEKKKTHTMDSNQQSSDSAAGALLRHHWGDVNALPLTKPFMGKDDRMHFSLNHSLTN